MVAHCQTIIKNGHALGLPPGPRSLNCTVQLALHCVRWGLRLPCTSGELAWEERFVGPLVSDVFEHMFAGGADADIRVVWKG